MDLSLPASAVQVLAWGQIVFVWSWTLYLVMYPVATPREKATRRFRPDIDDLSFVDTWVWKHFERNRLYYGVVGGAATTGLAFTPAPAAIPLGILLAGLALGLHFLRRTVGVHGRMLSIVESVVPGIIVLTAALGVGAFDLAARPLITVPMSTDRIALVYFFAAMLPYATRGGSNIVGGILDVAMALPKKSAGDEKKHHERPTDDLEYRRGRWTGYLERALMVTTVMLGQYTALGLIVAMKALMRPKEMEEKDYAQFFLIGSLASAVVGLACGFILRLAYLQLR